MDQGHDNSYENITYVSDFYAIRKHSRPCKSKHNVIKLNEQKKHGEKENDTNIERPTRAKGQNKNCTHLFDL